jgi:hypothetical protein
MTGVGWVRKQGEPIFFPSTAAEFEGGVKEGHDVFGGYAGLDVVDIVEDESAIGFEGDDTVSDCVADFMRRGEGQDVLGVDAAPPEDDFIAEAAFEFGRVHAAGGDLDGVEDIDAVVDQLGDVFDAAAAGVVPDLGGGELLDVPDEGLLSWLDDGAVEIGAKQRAILTGQVVADHDDIDAAADLGHKTGVIVGPEFQHSIQHGLAKGGIFDHVHEPLFQAAKVPAVFIDHPADTGADSEAGGLELLGHGTEAGKTGGFVAAREGISADIVDRRFGQRVMRDVHVEGLIVGHGPDDAELVGQIVPESAVAGVVPDAAVKTGGALGTKVAGIDAESLQDSLTRLGKLLDGVENDDILGQAEMAEQGLIGLSMDAGLEAAQVDRHPIGDLMIQGRQDALSRSHFLHGRSLSGGLSLFIVG